MNPSAMVRNLAISLFLTLLGVIAFSKAVGAQEALHLIMRGSHGAFLRSKKAQALAISNSS
jgi:hypothetical protein